MSYHLFLDDERQPQEVKWVKNYPFHEWTIVRSYGEFVKTVLEKGLPETVSFDHDLADVHYQTAASNSSYEHDDGDLKKTFNFNSEKTGYDCAKWLVDFCMDNDMKFPNYYVHSMNPIGRKRIEDYIVWAKEKAGI